MMHALTTDVSTIVLNPTPADIIEIFEETPHVAEKILRHLDPATGSVELGVTQCVGIATLDYNAYYVQVIYRTRRPGGKDGSHFMRFYLFTAAMRCLPLTGDGRVVMIQEYRRSRGEWVQMLPAGGVKVGTPREVMVNELFEEAGANLTEQSRIRCIGQRFMDDGIFSEPLHLLVVDKLLVPPSHTNPNECIKGIVLVPWKEWQRTALDGEYDDVYCELFAARCTYDADEGHIVVRGKSTRLKL